MILVGVDGSPASRAALRWALELAVRTGDAVEATTVCVREPEFVAAVSMGVHPHADNPGRRHPARELRTAVEEARASVPDAPPVDEVVATGDAGHVLTGAARRATLLVLGGNHLVGVAPGGVVTHCLRHAPCPVVVVPATR